MIARSIELSDIMDKPPHFREIWMYLIRQVNWETNGKFKRGSGLFTYKRIIDDLAWKVGYRTQRYKKWECEKALKWLMKATMIATTKTTRGLIITVCNFDTYQDAKNYESDTKATTKVQRKRQRSDTILKEVKNKEPKKKKKLFVPPTLKDIQLYATEKNYDINCKKFLEWYTESGWLDVKGRPVTNWKLKVISWSSNGRQKTKKGNGKQKTSGSPETGGDFKTTSDFGCTIEV